MNKNTHLARFSPADPWFGWDETGISHTCEVFESTEATPWPGVRAFVRECVCGYRVVTVPR